MKRLIKSPIQTRAGSPLFLVKLAADLLKTHNTFLEKIDEFLRESKEVKEEAKRIKNLPKGDKGERGERGVPGVPGKDGYTPVKGIDYVDGEMPDVTVIAELAAALIVKPKDGETPAMDKIVEAVVEELKLEERFKKVNNEIASYRNQLAGKIYGKNTWARGGGGGTTTSGKTVTTQYILTAVQSGADVTIDLTQLTNWATFDSIIVLYRNNVPQTETLNFTFASPTVTVLNADAGEVFSITYSYT